MASQEALDRLNAGRPLGTWGRRASVAEVNALAAELGVRPRTTKAATISAIERAPRPAVVREGVDRVLARRGIRRWGKAAKPDEVAEVARRLGLDPAPSKAATLTAIETNANRARKVHRQLSSFDAGRSARAARLVEVLENERRRLLERLGEIQSSNRYVVLRQRQARIDEFARRLAAGLTRAIDRELVDIQRQSLADAAALLKVSTRGAVDALSKQRGMKLYRPQVQSLVAAIRDRAYRIAILGGSDTQLAGRQSSMAGYRTRVGLAGRQIYGQSYNEAQVAIGDHVSAPAGKKVYKRIVEVQDAKNHPFSLAANGLKVPLNAVFRVRSAEVRRWAAVLNRSYGGIYWPLKAGFYEGLTLPAHINDRGYVVLEVS